MKKFFTSTFPNFMAHETLYICFPWYNTHLGFVPNTSLWTFSIYFLLIPPYFVDFCMLNADVNVNKINNKIIGRKCKQIYDIRISKDIMAKDSETIKKKEAYFTTIQPNFQDTTSTVSTGLAKMFNCFFLWADSTNA